MFVRLCREADARGNRVSDAYVAALAIESGSEWITTDRDCARSPGLRWRHPSCPPRRSQPRQHLAAALTRAPILGSRAVGGAPSRPPYGFRTTLTQSSRLFLKIS
ncbi:MAG: hypothetical protein M3292_02410 [Actinomycetota bacterium]|nr:hypothetical protein [Actinomycetota bacterium]